jgi:hypothetical protein
MQQCDLEPSYFPRTHCLRVVIKAQENRHQECFIVCIALLSGLSQHQKHGVNLTLVTERMSLNEVSASCGNCLFRAMVLRLLRHYVPSPSMVSYFGFKHFSATLCPTPSIRKKLAPTSPTRGGYSVGIVRSRTQAMEFSLVLCNYIGNPMSNFTLNTLYLNYQLPRMLSQFFQTNARILRVSLNRSQALISGRDSSVRIAQDYRLNSRIWIPSRVKRFSFPPRCPERL